MAKKEKVSLTDVDWDFPYWVDDLLTFILLGVFCFCVILAMVLWS